MVVALQRQNLQTNRLAVLKLSQNSPYGAKAQQELAKWNTKHISSLHHNTAPLYKSPVVSLHRQNLQTNRLAALKLSQNSPYGAKVQQELANFSTKHIASLHHSMAPLYKSQRVALITKPQPCNNSK
jgi:regulatory protein YycI of two-component signal transduction system YycFG